MTASRAPRKAKRASVALQAGATIVVCQKWEESERGWGVRPDGFSLHLSDSDRLAYIKAHDDEQPAEVPDEYDRPSGTAYPCKVSQAWLDKLVEATKKGQHGLRVWRHQYAGYPGDGGPDGWKTAP